MSLFQSRRRLLLLGSSPWRLASGDFAEIVRPPETVAVKQSAGTLLYRRGNRGIEVLLVHPSGGYNRHAPWSIPKGLPDPDESLESAARRETLEETGVPARDLVALGSIQYTKSRKWIHAFAGPAPPDAEPLRLVGGRSGGVPSAGRSESQNPPRATAFPGTTRAQLAGEAATPTAPTDPDTHLWPAGPRRGLLWLPRAPNFLVGARSKVSSLRSSLTVWSASSRRGPADHDQPRRRALIGSMLAARDAGYTPLIRLMSSA